MLKNRRKQEKILNVSVGGTTKSRVLRIASAKLMRKKKFYVVTPNPEQVVLAQADINYQKILNEADISVPDGVGLVAAGRFLKLKTINIPIINMVLYFFQGLWVGYSIIFRRKWLEKDLKVVRGRELFLDFIKMANKKGLKVYFLGGKQNEAYKTKEVLEKNYKSAKMLANAGPLLNDDGLPKTSTDEVKEKEVVEEIKELKPNLLFIGFGAPKQEKWMYRWFQKLPIGGAMVVGGTFKYFAGDRKKHPKFVENVGLEWLWRLLTGSQKTSRIFTAFPKFAWTIYLDKLRSS